MNWRLIPWGMLTGLAVVALLAWMVPDEGMELAGLAVPGVVLIFLIQGLLLPGEAVRAGVSAVRLHVFCQAGIFVVFPAGTLLWLRLVPVELSPELWTGLVYLSVLPTTVATAAAHTALARGQVAGAIFNIALSNFLGVLVAPAVLAGLLLLEGGAEVDAGPVLLKVAGMILLPFAVGQAARPWVRGHVERLSSWGPRVNHGVILFIVFLALCRLNEDVAAGELTGGDVWRAVPMVLGLMLLARLVGAVAVRLLKATAERKAAFFCVCQKSLATGLPMALAVFASPGLQGVSPTMYVLPLILYHVAQMVVDSVIAAVWARSGD